MYFDRLLVFTLVLVGEIVICKSTVSHILESIFFGDKERGLPCQPLQVRYGFFQYTNQDRELVRDTSIPSGAHLQLTCEPPYMAYPPDHSSVVCGSDGIWTGQLPLCFLGCGISRKPFTIQPLIIGGVEAHISVFPWHAGIYYRQHDNGKNIWEQVCGGSLITTRFVLTAGHCVSNTAEANVAVALGKSFRSWDRYEPTEQKTYVTKLLYPREFSTNNYAFDVGLILLDRDIPIGAYIMPVCHGLMADSSFLQGKPLFIAGWGKTENGTRSSTLLYNDVSLVTPEVCFQKFPDFYPSFEKFCVVDRNSGMSISQAGDSGGGLTVLHNGVHHIMGILSVRFDNYSALTNISWYYNVMWIYNTINLYGAQFRLNEN